MKRQYLEFKITHQQIERLDDFHVVGGSRCYLYARFCFCEDWAGETITAVFSGGGKNYSQILVDNVCEIPWEVLRTNRFFVSCFAGALITANSVRVDVDTAHCPTDTDPSIAPTPSAYEQMLEAVKTTADDANAAKEAAEAAQDAAEAAQKAAESGGDGGVFIAEYGVTPNAELQEAWADGKTIVCKKGEYVYTLESVRQDGKWFNFVNINDEIIHKCHCTSYGYWNETSYDIISVITPESIGAISAVGESIADPEINIDDLTLTKCYLCGSTVIKKGLQGDLPWASSFLLKVEDFRGDGGRAIQTAYKNSSTKPERKWRLWTGDVWSPWQDG